MNGFTKEDASYLGDFVRQLIRTELDAAVNSQRLWARAEVTGVSADMQTVRVRRTEEADSDGKYYPTLGGYFPEVGDDVILARVSNSWLVLGEVRNTKVTPDDDLTAPQRLIGDAVYTDGTKVETKGGYALVSDKSSSVATINGVVHNVFSMGVDQRVKYYFGTAVTNGSGEITVTLPSTPHSNDHVFAAASSLDLNNPVRTAVSVSGSVVTVKVADPVGPLAGVSVSIICFYIGAA